MKFLRLVVDFACLYVILFALFSNAVYAPPGRKWYDIFPGEFINFSMIMIALFIGFLVWF